MSILGSLFGTDAANAAKAAAADTYQKQQQAIAGLTSAGNQAQGSYNTLSEKFAPYAGVGGAALDPLMRLLQNPNSVRELPGYQFDLGEGVNALDRSAAARGRLNSGRQSKDLLRFGTGLADKTYGDQLARLLGAAGFGLGATGNQVNTAGAGINANLGAQTGAYGGSMDAAKTIGQGDVAAANAQSQALQNLISSGAYIAGAALGGPAGAAGAGALTSFLKPKNIAGA